MPAESDKPVAGRPVRHSRSPRTLISGLAEVQKGAVGREQLEALGLSAGEIKHLVTSGWLLPKHRGVFAVGYRPLTREGEWSAALLATGSDAVLSHRTAAAVWDLLPEASVDVHLTVSEIQRRRHVNVVPHRHVLEAHEATSHRGLRVTTPERTLIDLAAVVTRAELDRALRHAEYGRLATAADLLARLEGLRGRRGVSNLRTVLARVIDAPGITRSRLEEKFQSFLRTHALPPPQLNARLELDGRWVEVDSFWPTRQVVVELDGRAAHGNGQAFETDRARDLALTAAGLRVVRVTWRRLIDHPAELAADLRAILRHRK